MSKRRHRAARDSSAWQRRIRWPGLGVLFVAGMAAWLLWRNSQEPALPAVSTAQLDSASASLLESHLSGVRAARRSGEAWGKLAVLLHSLEFPEESRRCFEIAERLSPGEPRWPYWHASLLLADSPDRGESMLRRAVELCGNEPDAPRRRLARLLAESGRWEEAQRELQELRRARPDNPVTLLALAHVAQARGEWTEAISLASRCTTDLHTRRAAWTLLAALEQRRGDANAARAAMEKWGSLPPDAPLADPFEAEAAAIRANPRDLSDRAQRMLTERRLGEADPIIRRLVQEHPRFSEGWLLLGRLQLLQNEPGPAEQSIRHHLALDPQSAAGLFQLGLLFLNTARYTNAATAFAQATALKPDFGAAFYNLGLALVRAGRGSEAISPLQEAVRHNPERLDPYLLLADLHLQLGQQAEAAAWITRGEAVSPGDRRLAALKEKLGRQ